MACRHPMPSLDDGRRRDHRHSRQCRTRGRQVYSGDESVVGCWCAMGQRMPRAGGAGDDGECSNVFSQAISSVRDSKRRGAPSSCNSACHADPLAERWSVSCRRAGADLGGMSGVGHALPRASAQPSNRRQTCGPQRPGFAARARRSGTLPMAKPACSLRAACRTAAPYGWHRPGRRPRACCRCTSLTCAGPGAGHHQRTRPARPGSCRVGATFEPRD